MMVEKVEHGGVVGEGQIDSPRDEIQGIDWIMHVRLG